MAELFLARQSGPEGFQKTVVVKRLHNSVSSDADVVRMFVDEAQITARLSHANIAQVYDFGSAEGEYYIVMEYIAGHDLMKIVQQAEKRNLPLPYNLAIYAMVGACRGLHYAHTALDDEGFPLGIVHRDVSPQNILLSRQGDVKLVDFGIAKVASQVAHTQAGILKGKYPYMSPEQLEGKQVDARTDVFSAGIVLHELVCRRRLFDRGNVIDIMRGILEDPIPRPSEVAPDVPQQLDAVILRALARDREERYQSAQELQSDLEAVIQANGWTMAPREAAAYMAQLYQEEGRGIVPSASKAVPMPPQARPTRPGRPKEEERAISHLPTKFDQMPQMSEGLASLLSKLDPFEAQPITPQKTADAGRVRPALSPEKTTEDVCVPQTPDAQPLSPEKTTEDVRIPQAPMALTPEATTEDVRVPQAPGPLAPAKTSDDLQVPQPQPPPAQEPPGKFGIEAQTVLDPSMGGRSPAFLEQETLIQQDSQLRQGQASRDVAPAPSPPVSVSPVPPVSGSSRPTAQVAPPVSVSPAPPVSVSSRPTAQVAPPVSPISGPPTAKVSPVGNESQPRPIVTDLVRPQRPKSKLVILLAAGAVLLVAGAVWAIIELL